jgi:hypothetical protein
MSQKSSLPQPAKSVSQVLMSDIGGPGSFMIAIRNYEEFVPAKLLLEISGVMGAARLMQTQVGPNERSYPCELGHRQLRP